MVARRFSRTVAQRSCSIIAQWGAPNGSRRWQFGAPFDFENASVNKLFGPCWDSIRMFIPRLSGWKEAWYRHYSRRGRPHFLDLMAVLFSIQRSAETGRDHVYVTRYNGDGALVAMLNARLSAELYKRYADLIGAMLAGTAAHHWLERSSLQAALAKARAEVPQIAAGHPIWDAAARLFPEVYDGMLRAELTDCDQLPTWAASPSEPRRRLPEDFAHLLANLANRADLRDSR